MEVKEEPKEIVKEEVKEEPKEEPNEENKELEGEYEYYDEEDDAEKVEELKKQEPVLTELPAKADSEKPNEPYKVTEEQKMALSEVLKKILSSKINIELYNMVEKSMNQSKIDQVIVYASEIFVNFVESVLTSFPEL